MGIKFVGRTLARAQAMQLLFQAEACGRAVDDVIEGGEYALDQGPLDEFAEELARGTFGLIPEIDAALERFSEGWSVYRMPAVDRSLLRQAIYEMVAVEEVDPAVTIDETVELAKAFGTDDSPRFVNGLLGRVAAELAAGNDVLAADAAAEAEE